MPTWSSRTRTIPVVLALLMGLLATTGCGGMMLVATPNYSQMTEEFPFRAERPIARELRYTYTAMTYLGGKLQQPQVTADAVTKAEGLPERHMSALTASRNIPNTGQSDQTSERAREASRDGDHETAANLHALAASQAAMEAAHNRSMAGVELAAASLDLLATLGHVFFDGDGAALASWVYGTGVIGPEAPEGSILYLDMRYVVDGRRFRLQARYDFLIAAVLDDGNGRTLVTEKGYQQFAIPSGEEKEAWVEVPDQVVPVAQGLITGPQGESLDDLRTHIFTAQLAILASETLRALYRQQAAAGPP